ncbi:MAG: serine/threonine protein kinase [Myxococcota bacterium]|jgi:serine/threonine protein kinase
MLTSDRSSGLLRPEPIVVLSDRYACEALIGQGATARVYRAWDRELCVHRAAKILTAPPRARQILRQRLRTEARLMARLAHPHVLLVHDVGTDGDLDYVIMALAGESLQQRLDRCGPLPVSLAGGWMLEVLSALTAAHDAGIIHRDVKPQNILLDGEQVLLADFGIARSLAGERQTRTNIALGSLSFMAPEQRIDAHRVGPRADIYAAGATLYALVTGANPIDLFASPEHSHRWSILPDSIAHVLRRAMAYQPEARYASAAELAAALAGALDCEDPSLGAPLPTMDDELTAIEGAPYPPPSRPPLRAALSTTAFLALGLACWLPAAGHTPQAPTRAHTAPLLLPDLPTPTLTLPIPSPPSSPLLVAPPTTAADGRVAESSVVMLGPGTWRGQLGGQPVTLQLSLYTRRRGRGGTLLLPDGATIDVRAVLDPTGSTVILDGPRRARGILVLSADQRELSGVWRTPGEESPLVLRR